MKNLQKITLIIQWISITYFAFVFCDMHFNKEQIKKERDEIYRLVFSVGWRTCNYNFNYKDNGDLFKHDSLLFEEFLITN